MTTLTQANAQWSRRPADERFGSIADMDRAARAFKTSAMVEDIKAKALRVAAAGDNLFLETDNTAPAVMTNWSFHQLANRAGAPYVVMCNDCVSRVFSTEAVAKAFVDKHEAEEIEVENSRQWGHRRRIFWRYYPFTLDEGFST